MRLVKKYDSGYKIVDENNLEYFPRADKEGNVRFYDKNNTEAKTDSLTIGDVTVSGRLKPFNLTDFIVDLFSKDSYKEATKDFDYSTRSRDNIINVSNGAEGLRIRLEMFGMRKGPNGYYFPNPNYLKEDINKKDSAEVSEFFGSDRGIDTWNQYLRQCAANGNTFNANIGRPTTGDAWTRHGIYGDSAIVVNPNVDKKNYSELMGFKLNGVNRDNGNYVSDHIDEVDLQTGDIVDMAHRGSEYQREAYKKGDYNRANTHTGFIIKTGQNKRDTYVGHYQGNGHITIEPIGNLIGPGLFKTNYITGIRRPGTKKHPYK